MGALKAGSKLVLYRLAVFLSLSVALFSHDHHKLHAARFARLHELSQLLSPNLEALGTSLLLGVTSFNHFACVRPTTTRSELGNLLICAPTRAGKGLLAVSQLLTSQNSIVVNDIKGDLFSQTAGYRQKLGKVFVIDPQGVGHQYDPFYGRMTEDKLYSSAKHLLYDPNDREAIFTQRASKMLTQIFLAGRIENKAAGKEQYRLLPYVRQMVDLGLKGAAARLQTISPELAIRFLDGEFDPQKVYTENKFLTSAWETLTSRLFALLTEDVIRCFAGSDFTAKELMTSEKPTTVYLRWPEQDLLALSPLVRLLWSSLIDSLITHYDASQGKGCNPVLLLVDEAGRTAIPMLADSATTVVGRRISLWMAVQSLSQLEVVYGKARAQIVRDNMDSQLFYRPTDIQTAKYLEERIGNVSAYARSQTLHRGDETSEGRSERPIPLLSSQDIVLMSDEQVIAFHRNYRPMRLTRCDWRQHPILAKRRRLPPRKLSPLPELDRRDKTLWQTTEKAFDGYIDPDQRHTPLRPSQSPLKTVFEKHI
jgi:type IV secretion system protein VirD4